MSHFVIGLTGGIGSGKTTVANLFATQGITLVDADIIAREMVAPKSWGLGEIIARFGVHILNENGHLNRSKLRDMIFAQQEERKWLDNLLHPMIREEMLQQVKNASSPYAIMVVPLLFENNLDNLVDRTLMVDAPKAIQISRTIKRDNVNESQVNKIIDSQLSRHEKCQRADDIIDNQGDEAQLTSQVMRLHQQYLKLSGSHNTYD